MLAFLIMTAPKFFQGTESRGNANSDPAFSYYLKIYLSTIFFRLLQVSSEEEFTTEAQSSEDFLINNSLLRDLRASAVQSPSRASQESLRTAFFQDSTHLS